MKDLYYVILIIYVIHFQPYLCVIIIHFNVKIENSGLTYLKEKEISRSQEALSLKNDQIQHHSCTYDLYYVDFYNHTLYFEAMVVLNSKVAINMANDT